jgi:hypothetical protein
MQTTKKAAHSGEEATAPISAKKETAKLYHEVLSKMKRCFPEDPHEFHVFLTEFVQAWQGTEGLRKTLAMEDSVTREVLPWVCRKVLFEGLAEEGEQETRLLAFVEKWAWFIRAMENAPPEPHIRVVAGGLPS